MRESDTKLTYRQAEAVGVLLELYTQSRHQPIGYGEVARRLGVAPTTAYRLLRVAERRGYLRATYAPRPAERSAGRSAVLFEPTELARGTLTEIASPSPLDESLETTRALLLEALASPDGAAVGRALRELMAGLDEPGTPVDVAGRTIAALMINLEQAHGHLDDSDLLRQIAKAGTGFSLSTLSGMLLGLAWADRKTRSLADRLNQRVGRLEAALAALSPGQASLLAGFVAQLDVALRARRRQRPGPDRVTRT